MKYCVLNERAKFGAKIFSRYTDIVIFVLGYFNLNHPVDNYQCPIQCRPLPFLPNRDTDPSGPLPNTCIANCGQTAADSDSRRPSQRYCTTRSYAA